MAARAGVDWKMLGLVAAAGLLLFTAPSPRGHDAFAAKDDEDRDAPDDGSNRPADRVAAPPVARPPGLWGVLKCLASDVSENRLLTEAAGITFYVLLALFPALAALVSLYGLIADPATIDAHLTALSGVVPGGGMDIITEQVKRVASNGPTKLGFGVLLGLGTSLWSANQGIKALFDSLNVVFHEKEKRSFIRLTAMTLGFTLGALVFVLLAIAMVVALPIALKFVGLGGITDLLVDLGRWPVMLLAIGLFIAVVFRFGPSRESVVWRWLSWGSAFAAITWVVGSVAFSWYVTNFGSYNKTYGSLGAVIGFMTWIWISATVILIGAQVDAEMEMRSHRSEKRPVSPT